MWKWCVETLTFLWVFLLCMLCFNPSCPFHCANHMVVLPCSVSPQGRVVAGVRFSWCAMDSFFSPPPTLLISHLACVLCVPSGFVLGVCAPFFSLVHWYLNFVGMPTNLFTTNVLYSFFVSLRSIQRPRMR